MIERDELCELTILRMNIQIFYTRKLKYYHTLNLNDKEKLNIIEFSYHFKYLGILENNVLSLEKQKNFVKFAWNKNLKNENIINLTITAK